MDAFLQMNGYGSYIWSAYALVIIVMTALGVVSWRRQRALGHEAQRLSASHRQRRRQARDDTREGMA